MNRDTPDAVPSEDFPFLGPAISPRRREAGAPLQDSGELAGPFVGGMFGSSAREAAPAPSAGADASADLYEEAAVPAAEDDALEDLPSADWATDDFPWLVPSEPEGAAGGAETPWRATGEVEELARPEVGGGEVDHYSWIGEGLPEERPGEVEEVEPGAPGEGAESRVSWDEAAAESAAEEYGAFESGADLGGEPWGGAGEWAGGEIAGAERFAPEVEGEPLASAESFVWEEETEEVEVVTDARWEAGESFGVTDETVEAAAGEAEGALAPESVFAEASAGAAEAPVEAAPLPVAEWEAAPSDGEVEAEPAGAADAGWSAGGVDPLVEVAERLERIARALRGGKPIEAVEEGDPLQLLITGYALGYSQARRGRG